jgi:RNA polymerase sigma-70 factor (ECF subfamily)
MAITERPPRRHRVVEHDRDLVSRAQGGDRPAFAELYTRHGPAVLRLARSRLDRSAADDATAETFARAWRALDRYRDTGAPFVAWLYGIARHVIADSQRAAMRVQPCDELHQPPLADPAERHVEYVDLRAALPQLPARQRHVIELKYLAGLDNEQAAVALGVSAGAVNTLQWRALRNLQRLLEVRR